MKFLRPVDADAQGQQSPIYHTHSSISSSICARFTEQATRGEFPIGNFGGGGYAGPEMYRDRWEMRESIQRELEKERIREEIIAEEMARRRILEAEVRNELMMEREMTATRNGEGFPLPFMPPSHNNIFESRIMYRQPIGLEERIAMSIEEKYGRGGHRGEIRGFEVAPFQRFGDSPKIIGLPAPLPEDTKKEVVVLGDETLSGTKRKTTPPVGSKKKLREEWSCAICEVSATSERGLKEHLQGKKHQIKEAAMIDQKTGANFGLGVAPKKPVVKLALRTIKLSSSKTGNESEAPSRSESKEDRRDEFKFWCEMCRVGAYSEKVMNNHKKGRKHLIHLAEQVRKGEVEAGKTSDPVVAAEEPDKRDQADTDESK